KIVQEGGWSVGMSGIAFGEYLSKSHIPKPPKKTVWSRAKDKVKEWVTPVPEPVPAREYGSLCAVRY
ncbi:hypothetical protein ACFL0V_07285, partial [Nanoarchaeota archaeon]